MWNRALDVPPPARPASSTRACASSLVSTIALGANLLFLRILVALGVGQDPGAGDRDRPRHAVELRGEQALELPARLRRCSRLAPRVLARARGSPPRRRADPDRAGLRRRRQPDRHAVRPAGGQAAVAPAPRTQAIALALADPKIADWVDRYEGEKLTKQATFKEDTRNWEVKVWAPGKPGRSSRRRSTTRPATVTEAWTGPQVAWKMARGYHGRVRRDDQRPVHLARLLRCVLLLRPRRTCAGRSRSGTSTCSCCSRSRLSLAFFNQGEVFTAMPLVYPPMLYLLGRLVWIGVHGRAQPPRRARSGPSGCCSRRPSSWSASGSG